MIAPASPRVTLDPVVRYRVAIDAKPAGDVVPILAQLLIDIDRRRRARLAAEAADKTQEPHP
ncbi:MAG: hypothetical protein WCJ35_20550 [Planctomycetota bacterium]